MATHHSSSLSSSGGGHNPSTNSTAAGSGDAAGGSNPGKIRAAHLLVKHRDSRRPSSWKEPKITRSKEEAIEMLKGYEKRIRGGGEQLGDLATSESDCSSARKKGDLFVLPFLIFSPFTLSLSLSFDISCLNS